MTKTSPFPAWMHGHLPAEWTHAPEGVAPAERPADIRLVEALHSWHAATVNLGDPAGLDSDPTTLIQVRDGIAQARPLLGHRVLTPAQIDRLSALLAQDTP